MAAQFGCSSEEIPLPDGKLPGDIIVSILCTLPVKPLMKFKSVSKRWYSCITSPSFIKSHLLRHSLTPNTLLMNLMSWDDDGVHIDFDLLPHNHNKSKSSTLDDVLFLESRWLSSIIDVSLCIIDSCNGLVCLFAPSCGFILWNPATRKHRSLEVIEQSYRLSNVTLGMCYVEATNDFKIVGWTDIENPGDRQYVFVYTLSSDSWEKSDYDARNVSVQYNHPTFMSGYMHWLAKRSSCMCSVSCTCTSSDVIMAFDVLDGAMSFLGVPDNGGGLESESMAQTLVIRGCLSVGISCDHGHEFEIWVMEEYGVERSWVKRFTFQDSTRIRLPLLPINDGEIAFTGALGDSPVLTFYDPFSKEKHRHAFKSFYVQVFNYVESLASVGTKAENAPS